MQPVQNLKRFAAVLVIVLLPAALVIAYFRNDAPAGDGASGAGPAGHHAMSGAKPAAAGQQTGGMDHASMPGMAPSGPAAQPGEAQKQNQPQSGAPSHHGGTQPQASAGGMPGMEQSKMPMMGAPPPSPAGGGIPILGHLKRPDYMHVLINPMPVYGLSMGVLAMCVALLFRSRQVTIAALILIFVSGLSAWPVLYYGQAAYESVKAMSDPIGAKWLDEHMARGEKLIYVFYGLAAVALAGILAPLKWPRTALPLALAALALGAGTLGIGGWISYAGGHVRHPEFRFEPPPEARSEGQPHGHGGDEGAMPDKPGEPAKPMDHGSMPGMEAGKSDGAEGQPMQHGEPPPPAAPEEQQLEASRLQLEASRLQLEASRKQLEAATGASPGGTAPPPPQTPSPKAEDGHEHEH